MLSLKEAGYNIDQIETFDGNKKVSNPTLMDNSSIFGVKFVKTEVERIMLEDGLEYTLNDKGINVYTDKGKLAVNFDPDRFRPVEVPIMLADTRKIQKIGVTTEHSLKDIISDQLDYIMK